MKHIVYSEVQCFNKNLYKITGKLKYKTYTRRDTVVRCETDEEATDMLSLYKHLTEQSAMFLFRRGEFFYIDCGWCIERHKFVKCAD